MPPLNGELGRMWRIETGGKEAQGEGDTFRKVQEESRKMEVEIRKEVVRVREVLVKK